MSAVARDPRSVGRELLAGAPVTLFFRMQVLESVIGFLRDSRHRLLDVFADSSRRALVAALPPSCSQGRRSSTLATRETTQTRSGSPRRTVPLSATRDG